MVRFFQCVKDLGRAEKYAKGVLLMFTAKWSFRLNLMVYGIFIITMVWPKLKLMTNYGFINLQGELVIPATFYDTSDFAVNGLAAVMVEKGVDKRANHQRKDAKWGYIDTKGEMVIKDKNLSATGFNDNGMAEVCFLGALG